MANTAQKAYFARPRQTSPLIAEGLPTVWALALLATSIIWPRYGFFSLGGSLKATPFTALAILSWPLAVFLSTVGSQFLARATTCLRQAGWATALLLLWMLWRFVAALAGDDPTSSLYLVAQNVVYFLPLGLFTAGLASRKTGVTALFTLILISLAVVEVVALVELTTGRTLAGLVGGAFAGSADFISTLSTAQERDGSTRLQSVFTHSIVFGQFLAFAIPFVLFTAVRRGFLQVFALVTLPVCLFLSYRTGSRAAMLSFALAVVTWFVLSSLRKSARSEVGAFGLSLSIIGLVSVAAWFSSFFEGLIFGRTRTEQGSAEFRARMIERGLEAVSHSPVLGYGDGQSAHYAGFVGRDRILTIDSYFVTSLVDTGWIGLGLLISSWVAVLIILVRQSVSQKADSRAIPIFAAAIAVMNIFGILSISDNLSLLMICFGAAAGLGGSWTHKNLLSEQSRATVPRLSLYKAP